MQITLLQPTATSRKQHSTKLHSDFSDMSAFCFPIWTETTKQQKNINNNHNNHPHPMSHMNYPRSPSTPNRNNNNGYPSSPQQRQQYQQQQQQQRPLVEYILKILVVGDAGVGKTSLLKRYVHSQALTTYKPTIGVDFIMKVIQWDKDTIVKLQLWDIAVRVWFFVCLSLYFFFVCFVLIFMIFPDM